jgi:hypothetical protein
MKNKGVEIGAVLIAALSVVLIVTIPAGALPQTVITINSTTLPQGGTAIIPIRIAEATNELSAAQLNLLYDPTVVQITVVDDSSAFDYFFDNSTAGEVKMLGFQGGDSLHAATTFAELRVTAVGHPGDHTALDIEGVVFMGTGSPYPEVVGNGSVSLIGRVPTYNVFGMIALVALLAIVLAVTVRKR